MLASGVIAAANSEWVSTIAIVFEIDDSLRFCVEY